MAIRAESRLTWLGIKRSAVIAGDLAVEFPGPTSEQSLHLLSMGVVNSHSHSRRPPQQAGDSTCLQVTANKEMTRRFTEESIANKEGSL
jgi:hypothetical protein